MRRRLQFFGRSDWRGALVAGALGALGNAFAHGLVENNLLAREFGIVLWMIIGAAMAMTGIKERDNKVALKGYLAARGGGAKSPQNCLQLIDSGFRLGEKTTLTTAC